MCAHLLVCSSVPSASRSISVQFTFQLTLFTISKCTEMIPVFVQVEWNGTEMSPFLCLLLYDTSLTVLLLKICHENNIAQLRRRFRG